MCLAYGTGWVPHEGEGRTTTLQACSWRRWPVPSALDGIYRKRVDSLFTVVAGGPRCQELESDLLVSFQRRHSCLRFGLKQLKLTERRTIYSTCLSIHRQRCALLCCIVGILAFAVGRVELEQTDRSIDELRVHPSSSARSVVPSAFVVRRPAGDASCHIQDPPFP